MADRPRPSTEANVAPASPPSASASTSTATTSTHAPSPRHTTDNASANMPSTSNGATGAHARPPSGISAPPLHRHHLADAVAALEHGLGEMGEKIISREEEVRRAFWDRFRGKGRKWPGWGESAWNVATSSWLNFLLLLIPFAWASHFKWHIDSLTFALCFLSIIPLEKLFDYGGDQMSFYVGKDLGDLIIVTLNNAVEATLAIILLFMCELRILQATIAGVVLLHLLLVPGTAFLIGGARLWQQNLHPHPTQLNHVLLMIGVLSLLIPSAFFSALDRGTAADGLVSDATRGDFLKMSRGLAIILLCIYVASRIYLHNPPGEDNAFWTAPDAPDEIKAHEEYLAKTDPEVNTWFCILFLIATIAIMAATAEWLVKSVENIRDRGNIREEWFGLILLPLVSYSADGAVAILYFVRRMLHMKPQPLDGIAKARAIDLSIQFTLFWMPFFVLLSWWSGRPLTLLFDTYEVALVLGACFLVNYVTADNKTNWVEGFVMVSFYVMIALCSWFYPGQEQIEQLLHCASVAEVLAGGVPEAH